LGEVAAKLVERRRLALLLVGALGGGSATRVGLRAEHAAHRATEAARAAEAAHIRAQELFRALTAEEVLLAPAVHDRVETHAGVVELTAFTLWHCW